ncbi:MAG: alpha/beta hydrolase [Verrucomicrobiota bacterium]
MLRSIARILSAAVFLATLASATGPHAFAANSPAFATKTAPRLETGEIAGAKFAIAQPARWNRHVLLLAHGLRAEDRPLVADLFPEHLAYKALLEEGWIVAKTSYRRNGLIVADAIADLDALRDHIEHTYGRPERVILEGESMGGFIVTLMAEREPGEPALYHGAIGIGAALQIREPGTSVGLSLQPRIPLLFLTNQSELEGPRNYVQNDLQRLPSLAPTLFRVSRDGHVNVNQRERLVALRALNGWIERGRATLPRPAANAPFFDATVSPEPEPSRVVLHEDRRGFEARVIEVSAVYGNVFIDAQPSDFAAIGLERMTWFELGVGELKFRTLHGKDFGSVKRGEWVTFANADGFHWLARNYADAAASAKLKVGDKVTVRRFPAAGGEAVGVTPATKTP